MKPPKDLTRHYCTSCGAKKYAYKMKNAYYPLLHLTAWHCLKCMSTAVDNLHHSHWHNKPYLLELFAGSKTVASVASSDFGYRTVTVDIAPRSCSDIIADIATLPLNRIPDRNKITLVWASIPCETYSVLSVHKHWKKLPYSHRQYFYLPESKEALRAIRLMEKTLWLIRNINPAYYIIENPRGAMRHTPQMKYIPFRYTVSYNDYESDYYKPTDLFTNIPFLKLAQLCTSKGRTFPALIENMNDAAARAVVPPALIREILLQIQKQSAV